MPYSQANAGPGLTFIQYFHMIVCFSVAHIILIIFCGSIVEIFVLPLFCYIELVAFYTIETYE